MRNPLLLPAINPADKQCFWRNLPGASLALAAHTLTEKLEQPLLLITANQHELQQLYRGLQFFKQDNEQAGYPILVFPDWEILPYDQFSPHHDIISERIRTLHRLPGLRQGIVLIAIDTLMHRLCPVDYIQTHSLILKSQQTLRLEEFRKQLQQAGYRLVKQVFEHGEYAIRGSIIDLYPMGSSLPYRLDLFDDQIDSIRTFNPETQRSIEKIQSIELLPAHEFPFDETAIDFFQDAWQETFGANKEHAVIYQGITQGIAPAGIEYYLPLFFLETASLFDYLPRKSVVLHTSDLVAASDHFWQEVKLRHQQRSHDTHYPILAPQQIVIPNNELFALMNQFRQIKVLNDAVISKQYHQTFNIKKTPEIKINRSSKQPLQTLRKRIGDPPKQRWLFCASSVGRRENLLRILQESGIKAAMVSSWHEFLKKDIHVAVVVALISEGCYLADSDINIISESQLFGYQAQASSEQESEQVQALFQDLRDLEIGAAVVHLEHGIGRYLGLQQLDLNQQSTELVALEYAEGDRIYVPVTAMHLISRYSGIDSEHVPLHKLGAKQWQQAKRKARAKIHDVATELLHIYAKRAANKGFQYQNVDNFALFSASFPFEETPDQQQAIQQVIQDMQSDKAMDRLICGDVGFGKTEVAMRAAFIAAENGQQVAVLVPTTLLAEQHFQTFQNRFNEFPINIALLSRFRTTKQQQEIIERLQAGTVDIVIGTHKLLQDKVQFKQLGLLVIDEEHRFGVRQKEYLKALRSQVDILSLTATPIPRTLNLAMTGLRDISIIATPPAKRLAIKTFCIQKNNDTVHEAILREVMRGGQVFYLHNTIASIERVALALNELVPEASVKIAHGRMPERELEQIMLEFYQQRFNVLVCTTIIENGIDIPSANTIIIDRADRLGLAQLHQLRGRVGRSHHQAYAYLLTADEKTMTSDAKKRIEAVMSLDELGAGFRLASHDLDIRGTGELLGEEQSGHIQAIGFNLYMDLLERSVKNLQQNKSIDFDQTLMPKEVDIKLPISLLIPDDYIEDTALRLNFYHRIAQASTSDALRSLQIELIDRFGLLPLSVKHLFSVAEFKLIASPLGIKKINIKSDNAYIEFNEHAEINTQQLVDLIQREPTQYSFKGATRLQFRPENVTEDALIQQLSKLLQLLNPATNRYKLA